MKTRQEKCKEIRKQLKEIGINSKQVSVTSRACLYDDSIQLKIKDINVNINQVRKIADKFESIRYDEYNGEILNGCNTYVNTTFDYDLILECREKMMDKAEKIYNDGLDYAEGSLMNVLENGRKTILYMPKWFNGNSPTIKLTMKPEGYENMDCYCHDNVQGYMADSIEGIAEALVQFKYQYGMDI